MTIRKMLLRKELSKDVAQQIEHAHDFVEQIEVERGIQLEHCDDVYTIIIPEEILHDKPIVLIGGFSQGVHAYAGELFDFYHKGYVTVFVNPIYGYTGPLSEMHAQFQGTYTVPDVVLRKVFALDALLDQLDANQYHLVGHSQGGMLATHVAALHAKHVPTLTLVNPEGFQKDQDTFLIAAKFAHQAFDQMTDIAGQVLRGDTQLLEPSGRAGRTFMRNFAQKSIWRLTDEVPEGIKADVGTLLLYLKSTPVRVTLLSGHSDRLFTPREYHEYLLRDHGNGGGDLFALIDAWASFVREGAGHTALGIERPGVLRQIIEADAH